MGKDIDAINAFNTMTIQQIEEALFQLDVHQRALIAEKLLSSLDETSTSENEQLWAEEALRRYQEMKSSNTQGKLASQVMKDALAQFRNSL